MNALVFAILCLLFINIRANEGEGGEGEEQGGEEKTCSSLKTRTCSTEECSDYLYCAPGSTEAPVTRQCRGATPFCTIRDDVDFCTATKDGSNQICTHAEVDYKCSGNGYYPDPENCRLYHICFNNDHTLQQCPQGQYYDTYKKDCVRSLIACFTVDCGKQTQDFAPYQPNAQYYVDCYEPANPTIYRCAAGELFDSSQGCQFKCLRAGNVAHEVKTKYYSCTARNAIGSVKNCPGTSLFDPATGRCDVHAKDLQVIGQGEE